MILTTTIDATGTNRRHIRSTVSLDALSKHTTMDFVMQVIGRAIRPVHGQKHANVLVTVRADDTVAPVLDRAIGHLAAITGLRPHDISPRHILPGTTNDLMACSSNGDNGGHGGHTSNGGYTGDAGAITDAELEEAVKCMVQLNSDIKARGTTIDKFHTAKIDALAAQVVPTKPASGQPNKPSSRGDYRHTRGRGEEDRPVARLPQNPGGRAPLFTREHRVQHHQGQVRRQWYSGQGWGPLFPYIVQGD